MKPPSNVFLAKMWNSPTITTWGSFITKSLYAVVILPIVTTKFPQQDISIWLMLNIFIGFQGLADLGFSNTFVRAISYATGGMKKIEKFSRDSTHDRKEGTNWDFIDSIYCTTSSMFFYLAILFSVFFTIFGFIGLKKPISLSVDQAYGWLSFGVVILATFVNIYGSKYSIFLQGVNKIPQLRRWETFFSLASILVLFIVLLFTDSYFYLILTQQLFTILSVLRNRMLTKKYHNGIVKTFQQKKIDKDLLKSLFPSAWRSWIGVMMSYGLVQISGIIVGQSTNSAMTSSYLFSLKILDIIKNFSNAPFYSKIPLLSRLFAENDKDRLLQIARQGMLLSLLVFAVSSIAFSLLGNVLLHWIGANISLASAPILLMLILAFFTERYGAMHLQLYSLTNNIVWHIANGVSGVIYILTTLALLRYTNLGIISFPIGMLAGNVLFYCWYSAFHSYRFFQMKFLEFEWKTSVIPTLLILLYLVIELIV
jgi:O-antigen/teichoic acid export membrane protein